MRAAFDDHFYHAVSSYHTLASLNLRPRWLFKRRRFLRDSHRWIISYNSGVFDVRSLLIINSNYRSLLSIGYSTFFRSISAQWYPGAFLLDKYGYDLVILRVVARTPEHVLIFHASTSTLLKQRWYEVLVRKTLVQDYQPGIYVV